MFIIFIIQLLDEQMKRDENIKELIGIMDDTYGFLQDSSELKSMFDNDTVTAVASQIQIIAAIFKQTAECAHFVSNYAKDSNYCRRFLLISRVGTEFMSIREKSCQTYGNFMQGQGRRIH